MLSEDKYISESGPEPVEVPHFIDDGAERDLSLLASYDIAQPPRPRTKEETQLLLERGLEQDQLIKTQPSMWPLCKCPYHSYQVRDRNQDFLYWQGCKRNTCVFCTPKKIHMVATALGFAGSSDFSGV